MHDHPYFSEYSQVSTSTLFGTPSVLPFADPLPNLPMMVTTRLRLELLLQHSLLDLRAVSEVILSDAGATLQILRLIGEEYPDEEGRPTRIEDCIVSLDVERWYDVLCASGMSHDASLVAEWQHCRRVAECARELAKRVVGFSPEEAYLVGLLYRLGGFPYLLGWNPSADTSGEHRALGVMLADYWNLPRYLVSAIQEQQQVSVSPRWANFLEVAQQLADRRRSDAESSSEMWIGS